MDDDDGARTPDEEREPEAVTYHFPVHLEVVGELGHAELRRVAGFVFDQLDATLRDMP